ETTPLFAGASRLHRGVQRENVGLEGNGVDHAGDFGHLTGAVGDTAHGTDHPLHHGATTTGGAGGVVGQAAGLPGVIGVLLHRGGELFHAGGGLLQGSGLLFGAGRQIRVAAGDFGSADIDGV